MRDISIKVNDEYQVDFLKNNKGGRPVCRINGVVGLIDKDCKEFIPVGSTWVVQVTYVGERFVSVYPMIEMRSKRENEQLMATKLRTLTAKPKRERNKKVKKNYQFMSNNELKRSK